MNDKLAFRNDIHYMVVSPYGEVTDIGYIHNEVAPRVKDSILRALTTPSGDDPGTLTSVRYLEFRPDGLAILGSKAQWTSGSALSTRYENATYVESINFNGTYTATANTTIKTVGLRDKHDDIISSSKMGSFLMFYSTSLNMSVGSGGKVIVQWTITTP
jgi:hypothetical protein